MKGLRGGSHIGGALLFCSVGAIYSDIHTVAFFAGFEGDGITVTLAWQNRWTNMNSFAVLRLPDNLHGLCHGSVI